MGHAVILDTDFKPLSLHVYDYSKKVHTDSLIEEHGRIEPICANQGFENDFNDFLIGFKCYEVTKMM